MFGAPNQGTIETTGLPGPFTVAVSIIRFEPDGQSARP